MTIRQITTKAPARSAASTRTAPTPKAQPAALKPAGWAAKATGPKLQSARIGELEGLNRFPAPTGVKLSAEPVHREVAANGHTFTFDDQTLKMTSDGKQRVLVEADLTTFNDAVADFKAQSTEDYAMDWSLGGNFQGYDAVGKMVSVLRNQGDYLGGAHPNAASQLQVYDTKTGQRVLLDELLSKSQFKDIVDAIEKKLPTLEMGDDFAAQDRAGLENVVRTNFALTSDAKGKVYVRLAWDSGIHALGGLFAKFNFAAPTDAAFRQKLGLD